MSHAEVEVVRKPLRARASTYDVWGTDVRLEPTQLIDLGDSSC